MEHRRRRPARRSGSSIHVLVANCADYAKWKHPHSRNPRNSRLLSRNRFNSHHPTRRVRIIVGREIDQPIRSLFNITEPLTEFAEKIFLNTRAVLSQSSPVKLFSGKSAHEDTALPLRKLVAGIERQSGWMNIWGLPLDVRIFQLDVGRLWHGRLGSPGSTSRAAD